jgi:hypothetical protein
MLPNVIESRYIPNDRVQQERGANGEVRGQVTGCPNPQ